MQVGVIGINHKLADLKLRELLAKACEKRFKSILFPHQSHLLLSTCNRTEVYFSSSDLAETHSSILEILRDEVKEEFDHQLYSFFSHDCFYHLSRVTAGLDSACVAETEIQGQVKTAYETGKANSSIPFDLHYLFQKSLAIGKHVRSSLNIPKGIPDFEDAVYEIALQHLLDIRQAKILFVGASTINRKLIQHFLSKQLNQLYLYSKSNQNLGIHIEKDLTNWEFYDFVLFGSKSSNYLIDTTHHSSQKLCFDLSVPRNVDPKLSLSLTLYNIDDVHQHLNGRRLKLTNLLSEADLLVETLTKRHFELFQLKQDTKLRQAALIA